MVGAKQSDEKYCRNQKLKNSCTGTENNNR